MAAAACIVSQSDRLPIMMLMAGFSSLTVCPRYGCDFKYKHKASSEQPVAAQLPNCITGNGLKGNFPQQDTR